MHDSQAYRAVELAATAPIWGAEDYPPPRYDMSPEEEAELAAAVFAEEGADPMDAYMELFGADPIAEEAAALALRPEALGLANGDYVGALEMASTMQAERDALRFEQVEQDAAEARLGLTPKSAEVRAARALERIARGSYTDPTAQAKADATRRLGGQYGRVCRDEWGNAHADEFGRCAAAFHAPGCHVSVDAAATRDYDSAHEWRRAMARQQASALYGGIL